MADVFQELIDRGFVHNTTGLEIMRELGPEHKFTAYIGFDLTAPSLHVGSLIQLIVMRKLAQAGHPVIALLGEATTRIGDPSMRDTSRPMLDDATIAANRAGIEAVIRRIVPEAKIRSNMEWFENALRINPAGATLDKEADYDHADHVDRDDGNINGMEAHSLALACRSWDAVRTASPIFGKRTGGDKWRRGLAHFAESAEQNVPVPLRRGDFLTDTNSH